MKYSYMYVYTRMIFAAVLSPAIKIFHRHLGPNLLIFAVKVSPWFHRHFTVILWHITDISPRKNTDQGDFLLKRAVRAVSKAFDHVWIRSLIYKLISVNYYPLWFMMLQINLFETEIPEHLTFLKLTLKVKLYWLKFRVIS